MLEFDAILAQALNLLQRKGRVSYRALKLRFQLNDEYIEALKIATALLYATSAVAMSRSTVWRILDDADVQPHRSVSWLTRHEPAFAPKARALCDFYVHALRFAQAGRLVIRTDEKTGMPMLPRQ